MLLRLIVVNLNRQLKDATFQNDFRRSSYPNKFLAGCVPKFSGGVPKTTAKKGHGNNK